MKQRGLCAQAKHRNFYPQTRGVELLNEKEILKAACCNLSESFETNPSVDVNYTDAVTGAREIQLLGLSGIYTQMLGEKQFQRYVA
ncbi:MAG: hypothetical protein IPJ26_16005 [Bacteroidetes bacterium]|nr:hypothetical protein [Bacteroidota bacterium]